MLRQRPPGPAGVGALGWAAAWTLSIIVAVAACTSTQADSACIGAFRNLDPRALPPYGASPLDDAIRTCSSVEDWLRAWDAVPDAHAGRNDAVSFLVERCRDQVLAATRLCQDVASP